MSNQNCFVAVVRCGAGQEVEQGLHVDGENYVAPAPDDDDLSEPLLLPAPAADTTAALWSALVRPALNRMTEQLTMTMDDSIDDSMDDRERSAEKWAATVRHRLGRNTYEMPSIGRRYSRPEEEAAKRRQLQAEYFGNIMMKRRCLFQICFCSCRSRRFCPAPDPTFKTSTSGSGSGS
jgi:hypothetical protein